MNTPALVGMAEAIELTGMTRDELLDHYRAGRLDGVPLVTAGGHIHRHRFLRASLDTLPQRLAALARQASQLSRLRSIA